LIIFELFGYALTQAFGLAVTLPPLWLSRGLGYLKPDQLSSSPKT